MSKRKRDEEEDAIYLRISTLLKQVGISSVICDTILSYVIDVIFTKYKTIIYQLPVLHGDGYVTILDQHIQSFEESNDHTFSIPIFDEEESEMHLKYMQVDPNQVCELIETEDGFWEPRRMCVRSLDGGTQQAKIYYPDAAVGTETNRFTATYANLLVFVYQVYSNRSVSVYEVAICRAMIPTITSLDNGLWKITSFAKTTDRPFVYLLAANEKYLVFETTSFFEVVVLHRATNHLETLCVCKQDSPCVGIHAPVATFLSPESSVLIMLNRQGYNDFAYHIVDLASRQIVKTKCTQTEVYNLDADYCGFDLPLTIKRTKPKLTDSV